MNLSLLLPKVKNIFKILNSSVELPYDSAIPLLDINPKELKAET